MATSTATNLPDRQAALAAATALGSVDVLIIGAGINGAGTFRDLSLQGVRALIVDREDFGAGASMASSRMAHGGLRYLENGEFRLTAESTRERNRLLRNASHMVRPLPIAIPFFSRAAGLLTALKRMSGAKASLRERGFVMAEIGLLFYDWFGRFDRTMPLHSRMLGRRLRARFPALHARTLAVSTYYDAVITMPERIALELVDDGLKASPSSVALNHCDVTGLDGDTVCLRDRLSGGCFSVKPKLVLNAAGAWIDRVNGTLATPRGLIGGTKGSHLVLDHPGLYAALGGHGMIFDDGRGRVCVVYPMADKVLLGSTDIPVDDPDQAVCSDEEQAYFLDAIRIIFPDIVVEPRHVVYRFCGVRPLPKSNAATPGAVSRDHSLVAFEPGAGRTFPILSLVGGKWTTFRAFAEQVSQAALARLGRRRERGHHAAADRRRCRPAGHAGRSGGVRGRTGPALRPRHRARPGPRRPLRQRCRRRRNVLGRRRRSAAAGCARRVRTRDPQARASRDGGYGRGCDLSPNHPGHAGTPLASLAGADCRDRRRGDRPLRPGA